MPNVLLCFAAVLHGKIRRQAVSFHSPFLPICLSVFSRLFLHVSVLAFVPSLWVYVSLSPVQSRLALAAPVKPCQQSYRVGVCLDYVRLLLPSVRAEPPELQQNLHAAVRRRDSYKLGS